MASFTATPAHASFALKQAQISNVRSVALPIGGRSFPSLKVRCFRVSCAAKKQTVDKVCQIVRKQLALPEDTTVTGETKFTYLGADSLDTVEILMSIEEEFGISVDEILLKVSRLSRKLQTSLKSYLRRRALNI